MQWNCNGISIEVEVDKTRITLTSCRVGATVGNYLHFRRTVGDEVISSWQTMTIGGTVIDSKTIGDLRILGSLRHDTRMVAVDRNTGNLTLGRRRFYHKQFVQNSSLSG